MPGAARGRGGAGSGQPGAVRAARSPLRTPRTAAAPTPSAGGTRSAPRLRGAAREPRAPARQRGFAPSPARVKEEEEPPPPGLGEQRKPGAAACPRAPPPPPAPLPASRPAAPPSGRLRGRRASLERGPPDPIPASPKKSSARGSSRPHRTAQHPGLERMGRDHRAQLRWLSDITALPELRHRAVSTVLWGTTFP